MADEAPSRQLGRKQKKKCWGPISPSQLCPQDLMPPNLQNKPNFLKLFEPPNSGTGWGPELSHIHLWLTFYIQTTAMGYNHIITFHPLASKINSFLRCKMHSFPPNSLTNLNLNSLQYINSRI